MQEKIGRMEAHASELLEEEASVQQEEAKAPGGLHGSHDLIWPLSGFAGVRMLGSQNFVQDPRGLIWGQSTYWILLVEY